jgi:hypothetical protein
MAKKVTKTKIVPKKKISKKKSTKKSTKKKTIPKKNIVKKTSKKVIPKKITKRIPKKIPVSNTEIETADPPLNIKIQAWKTGMELEKAGITQSRVLRPKSELWDKRKEIQKKGKRKSGLVVFVDGLTKAGKSNFAHSAVDFKGFKGKKRDIPAGYPCYVLDTDLGSVDEAEYSKFDKITEGKLIVEEVFEEHPITKILDPIKSIEKLEEWTYAIKEENVGTLVIDTFTDYCKWLQWKLEEMKIGHDEEGNLKKDKKTGKTKKLSRYDWGWLYKRVNTFLRTVKKMNINVILLAKVKKDYANPEPNNQYSAYWTGDYNAEATKGFDYWVDIIARYTKTKNDDGSVTRMLEISDSRFETVDQRNRKKEISGNPTFEGLINLFKDLI